jgi:rare lipoprotein A
MAGASSVVLAVVMITLSTRTVHADAPLSRPASTASPAAPAVSATPEALAPKATASTKRNKMLHGIASWYGGIFHGRNTASGERFNMYAMTACHPNLPFGTMVRVVNLENKQSVVVRITDRGDLVGGRVIDLSYGAAQRLAMTKVGLASVKLEVLSLGRASPGR